jgi:hypothetical protein
MWRNPASFFRDFVARGTATLLFAVTLVLQLAFVQFLSFPSTADAAVVTIDATVNLDANSFFFGGSQTVFTTDQIGYKFYRDSTGICVYSKTLNGGTSWGGAVTVDAQTDCSAISVWYDQWTSGDFGSYIHIVTMDSGNDDLWYNRLDTTSDTRLMGTAPVSMVVAEPQGGALSAGVTHPTITKSTGGEIFAGVSAAADSYVMRCSASCNLTTGWSQAGTLFMDLANDYNLLLPLISGSVMLINRDISTNHIRSRIWNGSSWSASWEVIDTTAVVSQTYDVGMAAVVDHSSGDVYLVYAADHNTYTTADHDIRSAKFSGGSWAVTTSVFTNTTRGLTNVALGFDINTSTIYVVYVLRTTIGTATSGNVYWATTTTAMSAWGAEQGPLNVTAGDHRGLDVNLMSDERLYVSWEDPSPDDIFGNTMADIAPTTKLYASGTPATTVVASTSATRAGSATYALRESVTSRNVTDIVITERGTINAATALDNIKLYYDLDTSAPYDCSGESYSGSETQFGTTDTNGFSGADGTASFSDLVSISTTQAMCIYVVLDVLESALDGDTVSVSVEDPNNDILVTGGIDVMPSGPVRFSGTTLVQNDELTQTHFHWRTDTGIETAALSATAGIADTAIPAILPNNPRRLRLQVSNEGALSSAATQFRLEYAESSPTCADATAWTDVNATNDAWNMSLSSFITEGSNTTNISVANGGMADENTTFLVANGGLRESTSQTGSLTLLSTNFVELEYSIVASTTAVEGTTYCFRVSDAGSPLAVYSQYAAATIAADIGVTASGTQTTSITIPSTNQNIGGQFVMKENTSNRSITSITIAETGTVDAVLGLDNIKLLYDLDTTLPYDCSSESYSGAESQFGSTDTDGFSGANGTSTFTGTLAVATTSIACMYVVSDITGTAVNGETIQIEITSPTNDVVVSAGSVSPSTPIGIAGTTTLAGAVITQTGYHWRTNDGSEATSTSAAGGFENTIISDHTANSIVRLRVALSNEGAASSATTSYRLEFGPRLTTCSAVSVWTPVGDANDDWNMYDSLNFPHGTNTTNIAVATGGVTDPNPSFVVNNAGMRDTTGTTSDIQLSQTQFAEFEFSLVSTNITAYNTTYCFRLTNNTVALPSYIEYPQITTAPKRDYKVQRGVTTMATISQTLTAGVDYVAPSASSSAFIRITDTHHTGPGRTTAGGGAQNADDTTVYISNPTNITTSVTLSRPATAGGNARVTWEIIEFIGDPSTDNEMFVRGGGTVNLVSAVTAATGTVVSSVSDDSDVVVFVTGIANRDLGRNVFYAGQVTASWDAATNQPIFNRGSTGAIIDVSYAVVEYTGINWRIQRVENTYSTTTIAESKSMTPVNSLARTFVHTQKRMSALGNVNNFGHEVWLSSIGAVSFKLESLATTPSGHVSVAWVIENQQTSDGAMQVQRNAYTIPSSATEPYTQSISIFTPLEALSNSSVFSNSRVVGANTTFPLVFAGVRITSTSTFEVWRSEATADMTLRTELVEWPVHGLAVRQNYYRFYEDNNATTPTDPWPPGATDLGENSPLSVAEEPLGDGERVRLRMTLRVSNANLPAGLYDFKLQYGLRDTPSCTAIASWNDVDSSGGSGIWRGHAATGTTNGAAVGINPPNPGELLISVSDRAGSLVEENPAPANPYLTDPDEDIEYDWFIEHNGAIERSTYCFRMVRSDGTPLDGYFNYPQLRTAGYSPQTRNWRFYDDAASETQTVALSAENVSPIEVQNTNVIALRVTVGERKGVTGQNVKFSLQYDESSSFTNPITLTSTSTCTATSTWCYAAGGGADNATITTKVLSDANSCAASVGDGCGSHNSSGEFVTGFSHPASADREFVFYLQHAAARAGAVYYFRLYEVFEDVPVPLASGESYPSLVAETPKLTMNVAGLPGGTATAGILTTVASTPSTIAFGSLPIGTDTYAAHRISLTTNATDGYHVYSFARQQLLNVYGVPIASISGTNAVPVAWATGCQSGAAGCVGYHTTDSTLTLGSTRFSPLDSYAGLHTSPAEIMYSPIPANDSHDIVYRVLARQLQPAGNYQTEIVYIAVPSY